MTRDAGSVARVALGRADVVIRPQPAYREPTADQYNQPAEDGSLPLPLLRAKIDRWAATAEKSGPGAHP